MENLTYKISITGDLGSGKSTVCKILSEKLQAEIISIGTIQRAMAKEMGMTTYEFNHYMETHPEIDDKFDTMLKSYDQVIGKNLLFDSRLAWNFVPSAFSVYLTTDLAEAARRVVNANRDNEGYSSEIEAMQRLSERRASEILRYSAAYGLNIKDFSNYNFIVDSTSASPEEVVDAIINGYKEHVKNTAKNTRLYSPIRLYPLQNAKETGPLQVVVYNDFLFVLSGVEKLRDAIKNNVTLIDCELVNLPIQDAGEYLLQNCSKEYLVEWERQTGGKLIRYPVF